MDEGVLKEGVKLLREKENCEKQLDKFESLYNGVSQVTLRDGNRIISDVRTATFTMDSETMNLIKIVIIEKLKLRLKEIDEKISNL